MDESPPPGMFTRNVELIRQIRERIAALIKQLEESVGVGAHPVKQGDDTESE
jgi:hypothetical protein